MEECCEAGSRTTWGQEGEGEGEDSHKMQELAVELREEFLGAAGQLDTHTTHVNIARVTGGSAAIAGGVTAVVGFALVPVTMGLSAVVAGITGAAIATAGGLTAGGASVAKIFIEKFKLKALVSKWADFQQLLEKELKEKEPDAYQRLLQEVRTRTGAATGTAGAAAGALGASAAAARTGVLAVRAAATETAAAGGAAAARLATAAAAGSIILNTLLIGISLYDVIDGSLELHRQTGSKAGDYLRQLAQALDDFAHTGLTRDLLISLYL